MGEMTYTYIKDLRPGLKNINIMFIVLEIAKPTRTKDGHEVRSCKVSDKTGCVNISLWDELGEALQTGDICRLTKGYANVWKGSLTLYSSKFGDIVKLGEFCMQFSETPNMSEPNPEYLKTPEGQQSQRKSPTDSNDPNNGGNNTSSQPGNRPLPSSNYGPHNAGFPQNTNNQRMTRPPVPQGRGGQTQINNGRGRGGRR
ncbi:hypothetical protein SNE40_022428 [Patella caerulea]|uniref:SOSS complex subunit B2 n=1 Tax=Patella caerulea TaxID=87958 RepID=A0AAN8G0B9_PATCE